MLLFVRQVGVHLNSNIVENIAECQFLGGKLRDLKCVPFAIIIQDPLLAKDLVLGLLTCGTMVLPAICPLYWVYFWNSNYYL